MAFDGGCSIRRRPCNNQPAQQEGGNMRGQEGSARGGNTTMSFAIFCCTTLAIRGIVVYCAASALRGIVVCRATTGIRGIVFGCTTMVTGDLVFFGLTTTGIHGIVFCRSTLVVGIVIFRPTMPLWRYAVLSSAAPPWQCAGNTTISQKRDSRQRCI